MLTLFSYPDLYGVADNNPYGLKVYALLKLCKLAFRHEHILDTKNAPRGQLPYLLDGEKTIGDSDAIISHLIARYALPIDSGLMASQRDTDLLVRRMLDDLYWVMSYSRWKDESYRPAFLQAFRREHPSLTEEGLHKAQEFNALRYHYQGIGRYAPAAAYARGIADLQVLANLIPPTGFLHGPQPGSIDAAIYGFLANIYFYEIDTPLRQFVAAQRNLVRHCAEIHAAIA